METTHPLGAWLRLVLTPGVGNETARKLLAIFGSAQAIFEQDEHTLAQLVSARQTQALQSVPADCSATLDTAQQWLAQDPLRRRIVTLADADYPPALLRTSDPPLLLHALGRIEALGSLHPEASLAVVGSRNPSPQGRDHAHAFSRELASQGLCIVSGLALGVDGAAHEGALVSPPHDGLCTLAVVGTGLDRVYPRQHLELARQIGERGLLLSEYLLGTPPLNANFPKRNRIIAGLAQATLVVEAAMQSGSLITARLALEEGRDVMAIPGSIHSPQARGCHALIKQGAQLVETAEDVLQQWPGRLYSLEPLPSLSESSPSPENEHALLQWMGHDPVHPDALQARCGWPASHMLGQLLELELSGQVTRLPGGLYQRTGGA